MLRPKNKKILDFLPKKFFFLAITFEPEMLDGQSKVLKTHIYSLVSTKNLSQKIGLWCWHQGLVTLAKNA